MRSPLAVHATEMHAAVTRSRKVEAARAGLSYLEPMPLEACGVTFDGNDYCTKPEGHHGPHNIRSSQELEDLRDIGFDSPDPGEN